MAYVKPFTFVDGNVLDADNLESNDNALRIYENQNVVANDYKDNAFSTEEFQLGDYQPITNEYCFATGIATGNHTSSTQIKQAYWTSTIKKGRLNDNTLPIWSSLYHTAPAVYIERPAKILITFGADSKSADNAIALSGFWDTTLKLGYRKDDGPLIFTEQARSFSFEECAFSNPSSGNVNPFGGTGTPSTTGDEANGDAQNGLRRWIGFSAIIPVTAGLYKFSLYANAKVEEGFLTARQFKCEVFYD